MQGQGETRCRHYSTIGSSFPRSHCSCDGLSASGPPNSTGRDRSQWDARSPVALLRNCTRTCSLVPSTGDETQSGGCSRASQRGQLADTWQQRSGGSGDGRRCAASSSGAVLQQRPSSKPAAPAAAGAVMPPGGSPRGGSGVHASHVRVTLPGGWTTELRPELVAITVGEAQWGPRVARRP